ncbi:hypothetical protein Tco_0403679 [Tanacetum coccineum]
MNTLKASDSLGFSGTGSLPNGRVDLTGDEDPTDEDGDNDMGDPTGGSMSLGGVGGIICSMSLIINHIRIQRFEKT